MNSRAARQHDILITFVLIEIKYEYDIIYHLPSLLFAFKYLFVLFNGLSHDRCLSYKLFATRDDSFYFFNFF